MKNLFIHAHLIIDDYKEYIDGAILISEEHIEDVFINSNKIDNIDAHVTDLKGAIIMPDFYEEDNSVIIIDPLKNNLDLNNKIVLIGNSKAYLKDININYDGIYDLYNNMTPFDNENEGLVNLAFYNKDKYAFIDLEKLSKEMIKFTLNNLRKDRVILINNIEKNIKLMKENNSSLTDILAASSLNYLRLVKDDKLKGPLIKGKSSNLLVLDKELNIINKIIKGVLCTSGGLK